MFTYGDTLHNLLGIVIYTNGTNYIRHCNCARRQMKNFFSKGKILYNMGDRYKVKKLASIYSNSEILLDWHGSSWTNLKTM